MGNVTMGDRDYAEMNLRIHELTDLASVLLQV